MFVIRVKNKVNRILGEDQQNGYATDPEGYGYRYSIKYSHSLFKREGQGWVKDYCKNISIFF